MQPVLARAKEFLVDVPRHGKLAYCLLRDPRVPAAPKAAVLGALALIISPIDFPAWVPVLGELDMLDGAEGTCPYEIVATTRGNHTGGK